MSYEGLDDDVEINATTEVNFSIQELADLVRRELLKTVRAKGDVFGPKYAQRKQPLAVKPQVPGTQRIF